MKKCKDCNSTKEKSEFYGSQNECKECTKERVRKNYKKVGNAYDITEKGVIRVIYKTQVRNSKNRGHKKPSYSKEHLKDWLYRNNYKELYDKWVESGYKKDLKPSVDRIDESIGYTIDNIQLVTWELNRKRQYNDIKNGVGSGGKRCKSLQMISDNKVIKTFVSYNSAARHMGYSLEYQIKKNVKCRNGYYWKYK